MTTLVLGMALTAAVLVVAALASGIVERAPLSFPMIFLGLGFVLAQTGVLNMSTHNPVLEGVAVVSLALVLFLDAVTIQIDELRSDWQAPLLSLGPGTLLTISGVGIAAYLILGTTPIESLLMGAILSSTDPVVLRDVLRDERIPRSIRRTLGIEAGMNDIVVLPIVLVLIAVLTTTISGAGAWALFLGKLLILSPLVGMFVGGFGAWLMGRADKRFQIRREYQALYGIGLVLAAYAAGQAVQGDGFLAAFFAGLAVTIFDVELCDCFLEYGEVTSEMAMLLAFVLFGVVLYDLVQIVPIAAALGLAAIALVVVRPAAMELVLRKARISQVGRLFIGWFGPRGLSSLLLALLVVQAGVPNAEWMLAVTGVVVIVSVVVHGATATPLGAWYGRRMSAVATLAEEREGTAIGLFAPDADGTARVTPAQLAELLARSNPPVVLDVRTRGQYDQDPNQIPGSIRILPDQVSEWAEKEPHARSIVAYCT